MLFVRALNLILGSRKKYRLRLFAHYTQVLAYTPPGPTSSIDERYRRCREGALLQHLGILLEADLFWRSLLTIWGAVR